MKTYNITNDFIPTLLSLMIKEKSKYIKVSSYDLAFLRTNLRLRSDVSFSLTSNKLRVKTGNRIRNPKDFDKFIDTYIESTLVLEPKFSPRVIAFDQPYAYSEYVEERITKLVEETLETQSNQSLTSQGGFQDIILETQSALSLINLLTQQGEPLTDQSQILLKFPIQDKTLSNPITTQNNSTLEGTFYSTEDLIPLLVKGFSSQSYNRVYKTA